MFGESNKGIRRLLKNYGFKQWQVAYELGVNENTVSRWLRVPLSKTNKHKIIKAVKELNIKRKKYINKR